MYCAEVTCTNRGLDLLGGGPADRFGGSNDGFFLCPAPGVVGGQVVGTSTRTVGLLEYRTQCRTRHVGIEEVTETVGSLVLAGGVVGVRETCHEDDTCILTETLYRDGHTRGRSTGNHDHAVLLDHALGRCAGCVGFGLGVTGDVLDLLAENTVALERGGLHGVQHAAVAFAVQMHDGQFVGTQFVRTFIGIGTRLGNVEAQLHRAAVAGVVQEVAP